MNKTMRKIISLALAVLMCITSLPFFASADEVSQPREWFVSVNGDDINGTGTIDKPFKSIQKGADMLKAGDTLYIREGVYDEVFTVKASGTADAPITIKNYNNEEVVIRATTKLENWTQTKKNIWVTDMPWNMEDVGDENLLFRGEKAMLLARYPNIPEGGSVLWPELLECDFADRVSTYTQERGILEDADMDMPDGYWDGGKLSIEAGLNWFNVSATIESYTKGVFNIVDHDQPSNAYYDECPGDPYYIYDHINALDAEEEFYYDRENKKMYFYSSVDPNTFEMGARSSRNLMDLSGQAYINVVGLGMRGAPPVINNTHHINFEWIKLSDLSRSFSISGEHNTLKHSHVYNGQKGLVSVLGRFNAVFNCLIEYGGLAGKSSVNLGAGTSGMNLYIGYNTVRYAGRQSAGFGSVNSVFEFNDIYGAGSLTHDTGPHYTVVNSTGMSEFRYSWIHDNMAKKTAYGLYYDNGSADIAIHHNVVWDHMNAGEGELKKNGWVAYITNDPAVGMSVYNNTFIGDGHMATTYNMSNDNRMINNIFYGEIQTNLRFSVQRNNMTGWLDPKFVDMENLDFRLREDSLAIDKGIVIEGVNEDYVGDAPDLGAYEYGGEYWIPGHNWENPPVFEHKVPNYIQWHNVVANAGFEDDQEMAPSEVRNTRMFDPNYYGWSVMDETEGAVDQLYSLYFNGKVVHEPRRSGNIGVQLGENLSTNYPGDEAAEQASQIIGIYSDLKDYLINYPKWRKQELYDKLPETFYMLLASSSNLFPKGDFEDESYTLGVEESKKTNTDEEAASGKRSLKIHDMKYQWSGLKTSLPATTHRMYRISYKIKPDQKTVFAIFVDDHHPTDYDKKNDRRLSTQYTNLTTTDWTSVGFDVDTKGPTAGITIHSVYDNQKTGHYYIDDFSVLDITEALLVQEAAANFSKAKKIIDDAMANKYLTSEEMALAVKDCAAAMMAEDRDAAVELLMPILTTVRNTRVSAAAGVKYNLDNLKPGRQYRVHCNAWVKNTDDKVIYRVKHNGKVLAETSISTDTWSNQYLLFTAPENGDSVVLEIWKPHGKAAAYVDDAQVREYDPLHIGNDMRDTTKNIQNGNMESKDMYPWYSLDGKVELVNTDKGQSLKVTDGRAMQEVVSLAKDNKYTFSGEFKLAMPGVKSKEVQVILHMIENTSNGKRYAVNIGKATITNDKWVKIEGELDYPKNLEFNVVGFTAGLVDGKGSFLMDEVRAGKKRMPTTPGTGDNMTFAEIMADIKNWKSTTDEQGFDIDKNGFVTTNGNVGYTGQTFRDFRLTFQMKIEGYSDTTYPSLTVRNGNNGTGFGSGYTFIIRPHCIELQKYGTAVPNNHMFVGDPGAASGSEGPAKQTTAFKMGEWNTVTVGTANEEKGVRIYLEINGEVVYNYLDESNSIIDNSGHIVFCKNGAVGVAVKP